MGQAVSTSNGAQYLELLVSWFQTCLITYRGPIATVLHMHIIISEDGKNVFTSAGEFRIRRMKALRTNGVNKPQ